MGYWACGYGEAKLKSGVNEDDLLNTLSSYQYCGGTLVDVYDVTISGGKLCFEDSDFHWHEEDLMEFFEIITPYIESCVARYCGEDNCHWMYRLNADTWKFECINGEIYYGDTFEDANDGDLRTAIEKRNCGFIQENDRLEFIGEIIDGVEDFLAAKGIVFPEHFTSVIMLITPFLLTGGLHCDGFMDTMDGLFSGRSRERMLEIMKDSRVGSNGVVGFVLLVVTEWALILDMKPEIMLPAFFAMPVISRLMMVGAIKLYPYARPEGMGKAFVEHSEKWALIFAVISAAILLFPAGLYGLIAMFVATAFAINFLHFAGFK